MRCCAVFFRRSLWGRTSENWVDLVAFSHFEVEIMNTGLGLGALIAVLCSWSINHSILWAILHAFFGWFYVIYFAICN